MKKRILFVIESLFAAGAEKSMVTLMSLIDYEKYDVDLQMFRYGGELEQFVPHNVRVLPPLSYSAFLTCVVSFLTHSFWNIFKFDHSSTSSIFAPQFGQKANS